MVDKCKNCQFGCVTSIKSQLGKVELKKKKRAEKRAKVELKKWSCFLFVCLFF